MTEPQTKKASQNKEGPSDFLSTIGLLAAFPLLIIGLFSQTYLSLKIEWYFQVLAIFSLVLGLAGMLLAFSKVKKGISYGAILICIAAFLSILFSINTNILKETPNTEMILIGAIIAAIFGAFHYVVYYYDLDNK